MSEILGIDTNNYAVQSIKATGGGSTEDLTEVLNAQDTLIASQETKIGQMVQALANKKSIDLQQETADATATAGDITSGKTAYVNGEKITGNMTPVAKAVLPNRTIFQNSEDSDFSFLSNCDTSHMTRGANMFSGCTNVETIPYFDTSNIYTFFYMFYGCTQLKNLPVLDFSSMSNNDYIFQNCPNLTDETLNNIMQSLLSATLLVSSQMKLKNIGLSETQATTCTTLSNWTALQQAGWTTGY